MAAAALGLATAVNPMAGIGLAIMIGVAVATVLRPASILVILMLSVFVEIISVGGVTISRLIAPVALLVVLFELGRGGAKLRPGPQLFWAVAYALFALASALWTVSASYTMYGVASLAIALTYMLCFGALLESEQQLRRLLYVLAVGSLVVGAWSLASFKGWTIGPSADSLQGGRAQGGVGDPNFFAALQLVALPLILVLAADTKTRWLRYLLGFTALVALASILSTLSRGGMIALFLVLLLIPFVPARAFFPSPRHKALAMLVIAVGVIGLMSRPGFRVEVVNRATTIFSTKQQDPTGSSGGSGREEIWKAARHSISERPLLGVGYAAFPAVSNELLYTTPGIDLELIPKHSDIETHSAFIGTTAELGPFGLFLFVGTILATALALRRTAVRARTAGAHFLSRVSNAMILSLLGWCLSSVFISTESARPLWIVIGISLSIPKLIESGYPLAARSAGPVAPSR